MHLNQLQEQLELLNEIHAPWPVSHCLLDPSAAQRLRGTRIRQASEQLFTWQEESELHIALYIDPRLQCQLAFNDPRLSLHDHNLPALLSAAEGISHFLALSWCAQRQRSVSALHLELQAEIDKFLICMHFCHRGVRSLDAHALFERLFERVSFDPQLSALEYDRYRMAHRGAARLILDWLRRFGDRIEHPRWLAEARQFFRLPGSDKLHLIDGLR